MSRVSHQYKSYGESFLSIETHINLSIYIGIPDNIAQAPCLPLRFNYNLDRIICISNELEAYARLI